MTVCNCCVVSSASICVQSWNTDWETIAHAHHPFPYKWTSKVNVTTDGSWGYLGGWDTVPPCCPTRALPCSSAAPTLTETRKMLRCCCRISKEMWLTLKCRAGAMAAADVYFIYFWKAAELEAGGQAVECSWGCRDLSWPQECSQDAARCAGPLCAHPPSRGGSCWCRFQSLMWHFSHYYCFLLAFFSLCCNFFLFFFLLLSCSHLPVS